MGNSIRTTSKTTTSTLATFKAGDSVLCPSLSFTSFVLIADPYGKRDTLAITHDGSNFYYDEKGYSVSASDTETGDYQPSLFQDTPANRQAVATLYNGRFTAQANQRTVIDTAEADDNEVILISSMELSDIACDIDAAITVLDDIGSLLCMIYRENVAPKQAASMSRLSHDATERWAELLNSRLNTINKSLAQSTFGTEVAL